jgi:hypothetical protein
MASSEIAWMNESMNECNEMTWNEVTWHDMNEMNQLNEMNDMNEPSQKSEMMQRSEVTWNDMKGRRLGEWVLYGSPAGKSCSMFVSCVTCVRSSARAISGTEGHRPLPGKSIPTRPGPRRKSPCTHILLACPFCFHLVSNLCDMKNGRKHAPALCAHAHPSRVN